MRIIVVVPTYSIIELNEKKLKSSVTFSYHDTSSNSMANKNHHLISHLWICRCACISGPR